MVRTFTPKPDKPSVVTRFTYMGIPYTMIGYGVGRIKYKVNGMRDYSAEAYSTISQAHTMAKQYIINLLRGY